MILKTLNLSLIPDVGTITTTTCSWDPPAMKAAEAQTAARALQAMEAPQAPRAEVVMTTVRAGAMALLR